MQRQDVGRGQNLVQTGIPEPEPSRRFRVWVDVVSDDSHAEALADLDHTPPDPPCPDHAKHHVAQLEAAQSRLGEVATPGPLDRLDQIASDCQQQCEGVLRHSRIAVVGYVGNRYAVGGAPIEVDMVVSG